MSNNKWWRLENSKQELLGQLLLPAHAFPEGHHSYVFAMLDRMPMPWSVGAGIRPSDTVDVTTIVLYRYYGDTLVIDHGTLDQLERCHQVRFFPSYGLTSGKVEP